MPIFDFAISAHWLLAPLLVAVILYDLRFMRLPDTLAILFVLVFLASLLNAASLNGALPRFGVGACIYGLGIAANRAGLVGGGDVKVLAALVLNITLNGLLLFSALLCGMLFLGILGLGLLRSVVEKPTNWRALNERERYPVGLSIGLAGLAFIWIA